MWKSFIRLLPLAPKIFRLIHWILSQFSTPFKKIVRGTPVPGGVCTSKTWSFSSTCKNLGAEPPRDRNIVSRKSRFGWVWLHIEISVVSGPKFTGFFFAERRRNHGRSRTSPILNIFIRSGTSGDIRRQTLKSSEIAPNFACFWPLKFFGEKAPEILDWHYKIQPATDHCAKFHAHRPMHLGDLAIEIFKKQR